MTFVQTGRVWRAGSLGCDDSAAEAGADATRREKRLERTNSAVALALARGGGENGPQAGRGSQPRCIPQAATVPRVKAQSGFFMCDSSWLGVGRTKTDIALADTGLIGEPHSPVKQNLRRAVAPLKLWRDRHSRRG